MHNRKNVDRPLLDDSVIWVFASGKLCGQAIIANDGRKRILEIALLRRASWWAMALMLLNIAASLVLLSLCKYLYYSISVDISYKLALIWIIERSVSFQKSAFEKKRKKNRACEKGDTGHNALNAPFNKIRRNY